ncbi:hypothetical protein CRG98_009130 [Punica granatum]|uniref:Uncharacterized protein n=1 Tax=Punica granatum TaxID=22663 RepID=A0A2I0KQ49_PUNGR|nr:hypothetical protein CRG98_009130 [Punica granatum]
MESTIANNSKNRLPNEGRGRHRPEESHGTLDHIPKAMTERSLGSTPGLDQIQKFLPRNHRYHGKRGPWPRKNQGTSRPPREGRGRELPLVPPTRGDLFPLDPKHFSLHHRILVTVGSITTERMAQSEEMRRPWTLESQEGSRPSR